ncbi:MAG: FCD domain-containing protein [Arthrobacter sp.]|nr:FCD domain-containing protein [Arthrobacter sp.]
MEASRAATVLQDGVLEELGREIVGGTVGAGHRYRLDVLQERFDISRTVARDVMRVLDSLGLVTPRRSVGVVVNPASAWNVYAPHVIRWRLEGPGAAKQFDELTQLRIAVEPLAARSAAEHAGAEARSRIVALAARLRTLGEAGELERFLEADVEFHELVLKESGNSMFAALTGAVGEVLAGRTHAGLMPFHPVPEALDAHEALAAAIAAGEGARAERAARAIAAEVHEALGLDED